MNAGKLAGVALAAGGLGLVYMQFARTDPEAEAAMPADVKNNRLKKTLSNAGLFPQPEAAAPAAGGRLKTAPTGSMAVFTQGPGAALTKGGGDAM